MLIVDFSKKNWIYFARLLYLCVETRRDTALAEKNIKASFMFSLVCCIFVLNLINISIMSLIGNIIWVVFGGLVMAAAYFILAIAYCVTIIGIPVGVQLFKMAGLSLFPFGRVVRDRNGEMGCWSMFLNILWIVFGGIEMALTHAVMGLIFCVTIVGIPFGKQHFKLALLALMPFGKEIQ